MGVFTMHCGVVECCTHPGSRCGARGVWAGCTLRQFSPRCGERSAALCRATTSAIASKRALDRSVSESPLPTMPSALAPVFRRAQLDAWVVRRANSPCQARGTSASPPPLRFRTGSSYITLGLVRHGSAVGLTCYARVSKLDLVQDVPRTRIGLARLRPSRRRDPHVRVPRRESL